MPDINDRWAAGSTYEQFMGRWSRQIVVPFVAWLDAPADAHWLDVGCGTGALSAAICRIADPGSVTACDPAEPFVAFALQLQHRATAPQSRPSGIADVHAESRGD